MLDFVYALSFFVVLEIFTLIGFPLSSILFAKFSDRGLVLSKPLAILLVAWFVWFMASLHLLAFGFPSIALGVAILLYLDWKIYKRYTIWQILKENRKNFLIYEGIFAAAFFGWSFLRRINPNLDFTEKFMDHGFMISALKTSYFPPPDHFLGGEGINYYYYGHYLAAFVTKIAQIPSAIGYNLQMSFLFAFSLVASISIGQTLWCSFENKNLFSEKTFNRLKWVVGILAGGLVTFAGNLHYFVYGIILEEPNYYYPAATRYIHNTIHEMPIYSWVINDLHGHVCNTPNVFFILGLLISLWLNYRAEKIPFVPRVSDIRLGDYFPGRGFLLFCFLMLAVGSCYPTNAWDFPIYFGTTSLVFLFIFCLREKPAEMSREKFFGRSIAEAGALCFLLAIGSIGLFFPFWKALALIPQGISWVPSDQRTPFHQLLIVWGVQLPFVLTFIGLLFFKFRKNILKESILGVLLIFVLIAISLIAAPEFVYVKDIYLGHIRANTMFKFYFQAWIILGIISGFGIVEIFLFVFKKRWWWKAIYLFSAGLFLFGGFSYTPIILNQALGLAHPDWKSLDGTWFMQKKNNGDYQAVQWLNENIEGQPILLEAVDESYSYGARIASFTGFPAVLGWPVHEWLWRGSIDRPVRPISKVQLESNEMDTVNRRREDIKIIYTTEDVELEKRLLKKYHVELVYLGALEREKYPGLNEAKIVTLGQVIYDSNGVKILRIKL